MLKVGDRVLLSSSAEGPAQHGELIDIDSRTDMYTVCIDFEDREEDDADGLVEVEISMIEGLS